MLHPRNPPNPETQIFQYKYKLPRCKLRLSIYPAVRHKGRITGPTNFSEPEFPLLFPFFFEIGRLLDLKFPDLKFKFDISFWETSDLRFYHGMR